MGFNVDNSNTSHTPQAYIDLKSQGFEVEQKNGQYFVKIDGISVQIYDYDTVWTVKARQDDMQNSNQNETGLKTKLKNLKMEFQLCLQNFDECLQNMKIARRGYNQFLMSNHAHSLSDLKGTSAYAQGKVLEDAKYTTSSSEREALAAVLSKNNQIQGVCSDLMYLA